MFLDYETYVLYFIACLVIFCEGGVLKLAIFSCLLRLDEYISACILRVFVVWVVGGSNGAQNCCGRLTEILPARSRHYKYARSLITLC